MTTKPAGAPTGRPRNWRRRLRDALRAHEPEIIERLIAKARLGDPAAAGLCLAWLDRLDRSGGEAKGDVSEGAQ